MTIVTVLATVAFNLLEGVLHGLRLFRLASWIELIHSIGFVLLAAVLLFAWQQDAMASIWAHLVASGLIAMVAGRTSVARFVTRNNHPVVKRRFRLPAAPGRC